MSGRLDGKTVAFVVANEGIEQVELTDPWDAVAAGGEPVLVAPKTARPRRSTTSTRATRSRSTAPRPTPRPRTSTAWCSPAGSPTPTSSGPTARPWRSCGRSPRRGRPIAAICHGPWTLIEAGVIDGHTVTSWPSLRTDLENAGGSWVDRELVVDGS